MVEGEKPEDKDKVEPVVDKSVGLKPHDTRPWYPDIIGHREARRPGTRMGKKAQKQLEDRTDAIRRELGLTGEPPKEKE